MEAIYEYLQQLIENNQFFTGGAVLGILTAVGLYLRQVPFKIWEWIRYFSSISVELQDHSPSFEWLAAYACDIFEQRNCGNFFLLSNKDRYNSKSTLFPAGTRWTRRSLCFIKVTLSKRDLENNSSNKAVEYSLFFSFIGIGKKRCLEKLLAESKEKYGPKQRKLQVRQAHWSDFGKVSDLKDRPLDTIYSEKLPDLLSDIDDFLNSKQEYENKGIPYRRGYLLHGKPGGGKSTFLAAIANHVRRDLDILDLKSESSLKELFSKDGSLIVIEDIDCAGNVKDRESEDDPSNKGSNLGPSLSEILNAIDGLTTGEDIIFVFTTNHIDKLDPALIRPGRVDYSVQLTEMSQKEFEMATKNLYNKVVDKRVKKDIMPAKLQEVYLKNKTDFEGFCNELCE